MGMRSYTKKSDRVDFAVTVINLEQIELIVLICCSYISKLSKVFWQYYLSLIDQFFVMYPVALTASNIVFNLHNHSTAPTVTQD